jgi:hypothetical protein
MLDAAFAAWQPWWVCKDGRLKLEQMKQICALVSRVVKRTDEDEHEDDGSWVVRDLNAL